MPKIGDTKTDQWYGKYIWSTCLDCGKERWTVLKGGKQKHLRCRRCGVRKTATTYNGQGNPKWRGGISLDMVLYRKQYNRNNREKRNIESQLRRARKQQVLSNFTKSEWNEVKKNYNYTCACCGLKEPKIKLTIDHIIPICKGGNNTKQNIQPLCMQCNLRKGQNTMKFDLRKKAQLSLVGAI